MATYTKGKLLTEGKTKKVWEVVGDENVVIMENKPVITAFDDPKFTKQFESKATLATKTTCRVFELLKQAEIPVAYIEQVSPTEFIVQKCSMVPLEAVARRYAIGSYLKRNPNLERPKEEPPVRFHKLITEFFLKTTKGTLQIGDKVIVGGLNPEIGEEDPFIQNPYATLWTLTHSKKPLWDSTAKLHDGIPASAILQFNETKKIMKDLENYLRETFLFLEGMWAVFGHRLIDLKIEFGMTAKNKLVVADVIDNDSWRLRDPNWREISKEAFRQGEKLSEVEQNYGIVSGLIKQFRIPRQCLVLWRGSKNDGFPEFSQGIYQLKGLEIEEITASGHKSPQKCLNILKSLLSKYSDGGVIVTKVGMSNGLGPLLAARTTWPVIAICENMEDIWSNLRMPSDVPMAVICSEGNATSFALKILAQKNPFLYQRLQKRIEELDE